PKKCVQPAALRTERIPLLQHHFGNGDDLPFTDVGHVEALLPEGELLPSRCIHCDLANAEMIVFEHIEAALFLHGMVLGLRAPANYRFFVTPGRKREYAAFRALARETVDVDESIDRLQLRSQIFCETEILVELFLLWLKFEDHREHRSLPNSLASRNAISIAVFAKSPSAMPVA